MLGRFSVKKPYTVLVGVVLAVVLGVVSFTRMTTDLLPNISLPYVIVMTSYVGASPETVEMAVTKPVEASMATVSNIEGISSVSSENYSMVILEFTQSADMNAASLEIRENLDQIRSYWDDSVGNPIIMKMNPDMLPVMIAAVGGTDMTASGVSEMTRSRIIPELESIEGVASASATGLLEESVHVIIRQEKLDKINRQVFGSIDEEMKDAEEQLEDSRQEIYDGQEELADARKELEETKQDLAEGEQEIVDGRKELEDSEKELEDNRKELEDGRRKIADGRAEIEENKNKLEEGKNQLSEKKGETTKKLAETETQLLRMLSNTPLQMEMELLQVTSHKSKNTPQEHLLKFYKTFEEIRQEKFDGMIITGAPVEQMPFEAVDYWEELCQIMEWTKSHVFSTLYICWGAQAGLYYHYKIPKYDLPRKMFGIYDQTPLYPTHELLRGFNDRFPVPHSRHTD